MFTENQLLILDQIDPYIDGEQGDSRKGRSQIYPVIRIATGQEYWDEGANDLIPIPTTLVGAWIAKDLCDEEYYDTWKEVRDLRWERAEYKEVRVMKWVAVNGE